MLFSPEPSIIVWWDVSATVGPHAFQSKCSGVLLFSGGRSLLYALLFISFRVILKAASLRCFTIIYPRNYDAVVKCFVQALCSLTLALPSSTWSWLPSSPTASSWPWSSTCRRATRRLCQNVWWVRQRHSSLFFSVHKLLNQTPCRPGLRASPSQLSPSKQDSSEVRFNRPLFTTSLCPGNQQTKQRLWKIRLTCR